MPSRVTFLLNRAPHSLIPGTNEAPHTPQVVFLEFEPSSNPRNDFPMLLLLFIIIFHEDVEEGLEKVIYIYKRNSEGKTRETQTCVYTYDACVCVFAKGDVPFARKHTMMYRKCEA